MKILAIETSCDETAVCILQADYKADNQVNFQVLSNTTLSQIEKHREFGGVYPNLARREHATNLLPIIQQSLHQCSKEIQYKKYESSGDMNTDTEPVLRWLDREPELAEALIAYTRRGKPYNLDAIAVTAGPGLAPALWVGINVARSLAYLWNIPLVAVNHMAGHVVSGLYPGHIFITPALSLLVSGGHTEIVLAHSPSHFEKVGRTLDDAAGEAFDKVARMLELPYPGGPEISKRADVHRSVNPDYEPQFNLPFPMEHSGDFNFSFSGLKTACKRIIDEHELTDSFVNAFSREFEDIVVTIITTKFESAVSFYHPAQILCGGGVLANNQLRASLQNMAGRYNTPILFPGPGLSGDNAIMIAVAGYFQVINQNFIDPDLITAISNWSVTDIDNPLEK